MTADDLRMLLERKGIKQDVLARKLPGVSRGHISDWVTGRASVPETRWDEIRAVLDGLPDVRDPAPTRMHYTMRDEDDRRDRVLELVRKNPDQYGWAKLGKAAKIGPASLHRVVDPLLEPEEGEKPLLHLREVSYTDRHGNERVRLAFRLTPAPEPSGPPSDLGPRIRQRRTELGWSLTKMGKYLSVPFQNLSKMELGKLPVPRRLDDVLEKLAHFDGNEPEAVAEAVAVFYDGNGPWQGTAADLLAELNRSLGDAEPPQGWPSGPGAPEALANALRRDARALRARGVPVAYLGKGNSRSPWVLGAQRPSRRPRRRAPRVPHRAPYVPLLGGTNGVRRALTETLNLGADLPV